ncbi:hypothetical protein DSO57_1031721 [Entomophthora muscae]|uniref:Uncharacterized protein n=1 Tax=Entomophthora muscae TaxID=34485 RepID=A0ACC2TMY9_9FUNG|nr:hypothetical protein DSO57_1031721 [Entomophthora muscae]
MQDSTSKLSMQDAGNFPKVPISDTSSLLGEMHKSPNESYSEIPKSPGSGTEPEEAPKSQINKQKDLKSSHPKRPVPTCQCQAPHCHLRPPMPNCTIIATKFPDFPANVSYNAQGELNELPLDISNNMN